MDFEEFIRPPEAPVFQPTHEEFKDPIAYLSKIRPVVVNTGICKIKPPLGWRPPFSLNIEKFRFTPRLQPLNELDAKTRVKLNFLDNLYKFWDMQGISFKIPNVGRTPLDLHKLYKVVTKNGGFEEVCRCRKWTNVAREMQYDNMNVSGSLRVHYEKLLYVYEAFAVVNGQLELNNNKPKPPQGAENVVKVEHQYSKEEELDQDDQGGVVNNTPEKLRRSRRKRMEDPDYIFELPEDNPEFKKLAFVSPGPKNAFAPLKRSSRRCVNRRDKDSSMEWDFHVSDTPSPHEHESTEKIEDPGLSRRLKPLICEECGGEESAEELLTCRGCDVVYHTFCLVPQLPAAPLGVWFCPNCIAKECCQPQEAFGFEQAKKGYCLRTFGQMANQFKTDYFNKQPTDVPFATVEKEFWRLVRSIDDDVTVEYGADLHSSVHGSGFPVLEEATGCGRVGVVGTEEYQYAKSGWNLNNIPNLKGSVLSHIDANISGMKVPWLYVGMCFSCFCWHTEDHWSYSINYLHWGEPKTWYGVPSAYAEALEQTMKDQAPELFDNQPDLMHHLATTMSPSVLMKNGIPVVRTDQCAGEFVVTFPRAYHAGFNQGFNFAEAVNFSLSDWLPTGRESISHYRLTQKHPVFSHDELVCKMVAQPHDLDLSLLLMAAKDANAMILDEEELRRNVKQMGMTTEEREVFELGNDDDRLCCVCKTICFLSGVRCPCNPKQLVCPYHFQKACSCPASKKSFRYRHSLDELQSLVSMAQSKANLYCVWSDKVDKLLDGFQKPKPEIEFMRQLKFEAERQDLIQCDQYQELCATILEAERLQEEVCGMGRIRSDSVVAISDLKSLIEDVNSLPCILEQTETVKSRLNNVLAYQNNVSSTLSSLAHLSNSGKGVKILKDLLDRGESLCVELSEITELRNAINQVVWISETQDLLNNGRHIHVDMLRSIYKKGCSLPVCQATESVLNRVKSLLSMIQEWEQKMKAALKEKPPHPIVYFESMLAKSREIPVTIPLAETVSQTLQLAKQWTAKAQQMQAVDKDPHYDLLKELLASSRTLPVRLDQLPQIESRYSAAKAWIDRAGRTFLKKNTLCSLIEVLLPRTPATCSLARASRMKKKPDDEFSILTTPLTQLRGDRLKEMERIREMERDEKLYLQSLRRTNTDKQREADVKPKEPNAPAVVYCLCRKPESGYMLQCEVCNEWYHAHCLHIPKSKLTQETDISKDMRFICGACLRSRRPRLDSIVSLLISLQKVPVAISEGTALHCLAERAISWQKRAREVLSSIRGIMDNGRGQQLRLIDLRKKIMKWKEEASSNKGNENDIQAQLASQADSVLKHYEAQLSKEKASYLGLSEAQRRKVEDLLLEGDLLEVTTDESTQIWQLLQTDAECSAYFALSEEEAVKCDLPKLSQKRPTVVCDEGDDETSSMSCKKRRRGDRSATPSCKPQVPDNVSSPATKKKKLVSKQVEKKKKPSPAPKSKAPPSKSASPQKQNNPKIKSNEPLGCNEEIMDEDEESTNNDEDKMEDAICSAAQCIRPTSTEVNWVQCDTCQLWYHLVCVGLTSESVQFIEAYHCFPCKQKRAKQAAGLVSSAANSSVTTTGPSSASATCSSSLLSMATSSRTDNN